MKVYVDYINNPENYLSTDVIYYLYDKHINNCIKAGVELIKNSRQNGA